jgi:hypothetical protein
MTKTINVSDNVHKLVWNKWIELKNKGKNIKFGKVAEMAIEEGIDNLKVE